MDGTKSSFIATYNLEIGKHRGDAMVGMELNREDDINFSGYKEDYSILTPDSCSRRIPPNQSSRPATNWCTSKPKPKVSSGVSSRRRSLPGLPGYFHVSCVHGKGYHLCIMRRAKLDKTLGSIADLTRLPSALFVIDVMKAATGFIFLSLYI